MLFSHLVSCSLQLAQTMMDYFLYMFIPEAVKSSGRKIAEDRFWRSILDMYVCVWMKLDGDHVVL